MIDLKLWGEFKEDMYERRNQFSGYDDVEKVYPLTIEAFFDWLLNKTDI